MRYRHRAGLSLGVLLWGTAAWGATYYSAPSGSGTACSQEAPCSLGTGTSTLRPGDTLYLRGGTYNDGINPGVGGLASGSGESSRTTIAGYPGEMPVLTRLNLGEGGGFSWMSFSGLRIEGGGATGAGDTHRGADRHRRQLRLGDEEADAQRALGQQGQHRGAGGDHLSGPVEGVQHPARGGCHPGALLELPLRGGERGPGHLGGGALGLDLLNSPHRDLERPEPGLGGTGTTGRAGQSEAREARAV